MIFQDKRDTVPFQRGVRVCGGDDENKDNFS